MHEDYKSYLYELALEWRCGLRLGPDVAGMMYVEFGYVEGPDPDTSLHVTPQQAFAIGLHEIGHFALGHTQGRPPLVDETYYFDNGVLRSEAEAWQFAFDHFVERGEDLEPATRTYMNERCIGSYLRGAIAANGSLSRLTNGDRHHVEFIYDKPDNFFFDIRSQLSGEGAFAV